MSGCKNLKEKKMPAQQDWWETHFKEQEADTCPPDSEPPDQ